MMKVKKKWIGVYTSRIMHFGAMMTQYVEGAHSAIKHALETSGILTKAFNHLNSDKSRLVLLLGKVAQFALNHIKNKLIKATTYKACLCKLQVNYNIPCKHMLPTSGFVFLSIIPTRWLLFSDKDRLKSNRKMKSSTNLASNSDELQQKSALLEKLNGILAVPVTNLSEVKVSEKIVGKDQKLKVLLSSQIPVDDIDQIYNLKSDGNCGFRSLAFAIRGNEKN
ncbi:12024_t:CDS:2 [Cetraspora pellucida]|uniref:12024_t:CDS:1 n=1 Tax=Cetraspora pellucida TaxID=1433469 RepID=A0A9N9P9X3_9GLOM|nr:12024_t:CDS:2 [Cetraspora pellucida]